MKMSVHIEEWELTQPFRISNFEWVNSRGIVVQLAEGGFSWPRRGTGRFLPGRNGREHLRAGARSRRRAP